MGAAHPLRRFDFAAAILLRRASLVTADDLASLGRLRPELAVQGYLHLLRSRTEQQQAPEGRWPLPEVDYKQRRLTFWANNRRFRVTLTWRRKNWRLTTRGQLAVEAGPQVCALRWVMSAYTRLPASELRTDLDLFGRTVAVLSLAGLDDETVVRLSEARLEAGDARAFHRDVWQHIWLLASGGDRLCRRAVQLSCITVPA